VEDFSEHAFVYRLLGMFGKSDDEQLPKQQLKRQRTTVSQFVNLYICAKDLGA